jgi:hypothetical protein
MILSIFFTEEPDTEEGDVGDAPYLDGCLVLVFIAPELQLEW